MRYIIIGNGAAALDAAIAIRKNDSESSITLISKSKHSFYFRPKLVHYLEGNMEVEKIVIHKDEFYIKNNFKNILSTKIETIDPEKKELLDCDGNSFKYDKLLIAVGSNAFIPEIKGYPKKGVFTLRNIKDADDIIKWSKNSEKIVIAGGGLLGLEAASVLKHHSDHITVVEFSEYLLHKQLGMEGGLLLQGMLEKKGLKFKLQDFVSEINGGEKIESVTLNSGKKLDAEMLLLSVGVRPELELAKKAGIKCDKGIIINDNMETSVPDIYAAGDCTQHDGKLYGLWITAKEQGKIAGLNMAGVETKYEGSHPKVSLKITGVDLNSFQKVD